jgi:3-oxoacyl-[acyl-carrier protein] reductase
VAEARRVALVTGGGRGIGRAIAAGLASDGFAVGVNYARSADAAEDLVRHIRDTGGEAMAVAGDVSDPTAAASMVGLTDWTCS